MHAAKLVRGNLKANSKPLIVVMLSAVAREAPLSARSVPTADFPWLVRTQAASCKICAAECDQFQTQDDPDLLKRIEQTHRGPKRLPVSCECARLLVEDVQVTCI